MASHGSEWEQVSDVQQRVRPQKLSRTREQGSFIYPELIPKHSVRVIRLILCAFSPGFNRHSHSVCAFVRYFPDMTAETVGSHHPSHEIYFA